MEARDIPECVEIVARHPVIGPRYGNAIGLLSQAWLHLIPYEAKTASVVFDEEKPRASICFVGVSAFVQDDFVREIKTPPQFWVGPELARRVVRGESPMLSGGELRESNSHGGLNLVCWEGCFRPGYETNVELQRCMMESFIEEHEGYLWKEVIATQLESPDRLAFTLKVGGSLWDPLAVSYTSIPPTELCEVISKPHVVGITRDLESRRGDWAASWAGTLFDYRPPILGFNRREQHLVSRALPGATDEHLADTLRTSLPAVKKMWVSIYHRVEESLPDLFPDQLRSDIPASRRGRERRRRLLSYLREHPEELRPFSQRLLPNAASLKRRVP